MRNIIVAAGLVALAACAQKTMQIYEGPALAPDQQVTLRVAPSAGRLEIIGIDRESTMNFGQRLVTGQSGAGTVMLTPGKHLVRLKQNLGSSYAFSGWMWFVGEPGRTYQARSQAVGYGVRFWLEDDRGRRIGGIAGGADEPK